MTRPLIVTLNAGSSSLRCAVFERTEGGPRPRLRLSLRGLPKRMIWERQDARADQTEERELEPPGAAGDAQATARAEMLRRLMQEVTEDDIAAVAHRVVHGGRAYVAPIKLDASVLADLEALSPLAPSHQPHNLAAVRELSERLPDAAQIACFDTAFHRTLSRNDRIFALPHALTEEGVHRYGFHGLSFEHVAASLAETAPDLARGRLVVAHLGHGVSLCAMKDGRSVATTMGMTALDGVPMGTRVGALDPGIVLYLIEERGMEPADLRTMFYEESGLLGLSGISGEMPELLASDSEEAARAVAFFVYRCRREIGSLAAALGGLDGLILTGGMGEHAPEIRRRICAGLGWLGISLDEEANEVGATLLSAPDARVPVMMISTDEETVLARHAEKVLSRGNAFTG